MKGAVVCLSAALAGFGLLAVPSVVEATVPLGPTCVSAEPFSDVFVWFFDFNGLTANWVYFDAIGQEVTGTRSQSVSAFVDRAGTTLHVGYTTYPKPGFAPVLAGGTIDLAAQSGPGQCFAPDLESCGDFTFQVVACPTEALARRGRLQGQRP